MSERKEWLETLEVGNKVAVQAGSIGYRYWEIREVTKITPTRIFTLSNNKKYSNDGYERGVKSSGFTSRVSSMHPITQQILDTIEREELTGKVKSIKASELSLEQLRAIVEVLESDNKESADSKIVQKIKDELESLENEIEPTYCGEMEYQMWDAKRKAKMEVLKELL